MAWCEKQLPWSTRTWFPSQEPALGKAAQTWQRTLVVPALLKRMQHTTRAHWPACLTYLLTFWPMTNLVSKKVDNIKKNNAGNCPLTSTCILNTCRHDLIHMWTRTHTKLQNRNVESKHQHQFIASWLILAMFKKVFGVCLYAYFMWAHAERLVCCSLLWLWKWEGRTLKKGRIQV